MMGDKLKFVRLPMLLVVIMFLGRVLLGAAMGSNKSTYDLSNRLFSMVIFQIHAALLWAAVGRRYRGYTLAGSIFAVVLITIWSQALIFGATALSYMGHADTLFNFPEALNAVNPVPFSEALIRRTATFIGNCVFTAVAGAIGWSLGGLLPNKTVQEQG
jgi:hypothetical protein